MEPKVWLGGFYITGANGRRSANLAKIPCELIVSGLFAFRECNF